MIIINNGDYATSMKTASDANYRQVKTTWKPSLIERSIESLIVTRFLV